MSGALRLTVWWHLGEGDRQREPQVQRLGHGTWLGGSGHPGVRLMSAGNKQHEAAVQPGLAECKVFVTVNSRSHVEF